MLPDFRATPAHLTRRRSNHGCPLHALLAIAPRSSVYADMKTLSHGLGPRSCAIAVCIAVIAISIASPAHAGNLSFLYDAAIGKFDEMDLQLMTETATAVLNAAATPKKLSWENPRTGNRGSVETLIEFAGPNRDACKQLRIDNHAGSRHGRAMYTACNIDAAGWKLVPSDYASPPKKKAKTSIQPDAR